MTSRDVSAVRFQLVLASESAARLCNHLEDLHSLAWERHVGDHERVSGGSAHPGVETVGDQHARVLWARLCATAVDLDTLAPLERSILNYFTAGPSPDPSRGAIISKGEFGSAQKYQRRRAAEGMYTPVRIEEQPGYGGMGR